jgi:hypothetical protein
MLALGLALLLRALPGVAQSDVVPIKMQAELFGKLASYDRNFQKRAGPKALVVLVVAPRNAQSTTFAASMRLALERLERIGGLPHHENVVQYENAAALAKLCRAERAAAIYLGPGLEAESERVAAALSGLDVLSVASNPAYVEQGIVLGFDLVSGKPRILVNLPQAKRQNVNFRADVLKLMKVLR